MARSLVDCIKIHKCSQATATKILGYQESHGKNPKITAIEVDKAAVSNTMEDLQDAVDKVTSQVEVQEYASDRHKKLKADLKKAGISLAEVIGKNQFDISKMIRDSVREAKNISIEIKEDLTETYIDPLEDWETLKSNDGFSRGSAANGVNPDSVASASDMYKVKSLNQQIKTGKTRNDFKVTFENYPEEAEDFNPLTDERPINDEQDDILSANSEAELLRQREERKNNKEPIPEVTGSEVFSNDPTLAGLINKEFSDDDPDVNRKAPVRREVGTFAKVFEMIAAKGKEFGTQISSNEMDDRKYKKVITAQSMIGSVKTDGRSQDQIDKERADRMSELIQNNKIAIMKMFKSLSNIKALNVLSTTEKDRKEQSVKDQLNDISEGKIKTPRDFMIYEMLMNIEEYDIASLHKFILDQEHITSLSLLRRIPDSFVGFMEYAAKMQEAHTDTNIDENAKYKARVLGIADWMQKNHPKEFKSSKWMFKYLLDDQVVVYDFYKKIINNPPAQQQLIEMYKKAFRSDFSLPLFKEVGRLYDDGLLTGLSTVFVLRDSLLESKPVPANVATDFDATESNISILDRIEKNVKLTTVAKENIRSLLGAIKFLGIEDNKTSNAFSMEIIDIEDAITVVDAFESSSNEGINALEDLFSREEYSVGDDKKLELKIAKFFDKPTKTKPRDAYSFKQNKRGIYELRVGREGVELTISKIINAMVESDKNVTSSFELLTTKEKFDVVRTMLRSLFIVDTMWEKEAESFELLAEQIEDQRVPDTDPSRQRFPDATISDGKDGRTPITKIYKGKEATANIRSIGGDNLRGKPFDSTADIETLIDIINLRNSYRSMAEMDIANRGLTKNLVNEINKKEKQLRDDIPKLFNAGYLGFDTAVEMAEFDVAMSKEINKRFSTATRKKKVSEFEAVLEKVKKSTELSDGPFKSYYAQDELSWKLMDARVVLAQQTIDKNNVKNALVFKQLEKSKGGELQWSEEDFLNAYLNVNMDYSKFIEALKNRRQELEQKIADFLFKDIKTHGVDYIKNYLKKDYATYQAIYTDIIVEENPIPIEQQLKELDYFTRKKFRIAQHLEHHFRHAVNIDMASIKMDETTVEDIFDTGAKEFANEMIKPKSGVNKGSLRNKEAQRFYELVAKQFGARLVIVSDPYMKSQYDASDPNDPIIVVNVQKDSSFHHVFAHELWHHIVNQAPSGQYEAFVEAVRRIPQSSNFENIITLVTSDTRTIKGIDNPIEEVTAEVFATVLGQKAFYEQLAGSLQGQMIGRGLVQRLVEHVSKLPDVIDHTTMMHEGLMLFDTREMQQVYSLVNDMVASGMEKGQQTLNHSEIRYNTLLGSRTLSEIKGYLDNPKKWLQGVWKKIVPPGSKNYKDIMVAIEKILSNTREWIKNNKPQTVYADFMAEKKAQEIASIIQHGYEQLGQEANARIVDKHDGIYNNMTEPQMRTLHDRVVRGLNGAGTQVGGLDFKKASDIEIGLKEGISREVIDAFITYQDIADTIHKELRKSFPDLPYVATHYGQSLMWMRKDKTPDQEATNAILYSDESVLDGQKRFLQSKDFTRTTAQIARESGLTPKNLNPTLVLLNYVEEASKLIYTKKMMNASLLANHGKLFTNAAAAEKEGFINNLDDEAFEVFMPRDNEVGYTVSINGSVQEEDGRRVVYYTEQDAIDAAKDLGTEENVATVNSILKDAEKASISWTVYGTDKNGKKAYVRGALNKETAKTNLDHFTKEYPDVSFSIEREFVSRTQKTAVSKMYFKKDLHKLLDVALRKDRFREGKLFGVSGRSLLNLKNMMTSVEFAVSLFHASTIMQELIASEMTLKQQKAVGVVGAIKSLNPISAVSGGVRDAKKIKAVFNAIAQNNEVAKDPKVIKLVEEILGTSDVNVLEMYKNFINVGGRMHMDASERSSVYGYGKMKYGSVKKKLVIGDDEATIEGRIAGDNVLERSVNTIKDTAKEFSNSIKGVHEQQLALHPDKEVQALLKTVVFTGLQSTTAWLMEDAIPMIKLSIWAKQYAHNVSKYNSEIVADKKSTHSIAHDTMKFVEDKFGEVNWKSQWMDPTYKSALIFTFRSFTWFTGSWKALGKGGLDVGRKVWYTAKGEDYQLTEKGLWLFNVHMAHAMTSATTHLMYAMMAGDDEVPTDEDTTLLNKIMFPRVDDQDPSARLTIPGYSTEFNKIFHHVGLIGEDFDPLALVRGRFNTLITNAMDVVSGTDWRGVEIRHEEDMLATKFVDSITHLFSVAPISLSTMYGDFKRKGFDGQKMAFALAGGTSAPAYSKHSNAVNLAYKMRREQYSETGVTDVEMKQRESTSKAAYQYASGNRKPLMDMLFAGEISTDEYSNALKKQPRIDGVPNPQYKEELVRALGSLPIEKALTVWTKMTDGEKERMRPVIYKKYRNAIKPNNHKRTQKEKTSIKNTMYKYGVLG